MNEMTEDQRTELVMDQVRTIYRALLQRGGRIGPELMAAQHYACLLTAAGIRLRAAGYRASDEGGTELVNEMARAAQDAMEDALDRALAARN